MVHIVDSMKSSGIANPVGIVVDATDRMGSIMFRAAYVVHDGQHVHRGIHFPAQLFNHDN
jgi:hypothetical protein